VCSMSFISLYRFSISTQPRFLLLSVGSKSMSSFYKAMLPVVKDIGVSNLKKVHVLFAGI
jgi:hypothetical protein